MECLIGALAAVVVGLTLYTVSLHARLDSVYSRLRTQAKLNNEILVMIEQLNSAAIVSQLLPELVVQAMVEPVCLRHEITDETLRTLLNGKSSKPEDGSPHT